MKTKTIFSTKHLRDALCNVEQMLIDANALRDRHASRFTLSLHTQLQYAIHDVRTLIELHDEHDACAFDNENESSRIFQRSQTCQRHFIHDVTNALLYAIQNAQFAHVEIVDRIFNAIKLYCTTFNVECVSRYQFNTNDR